MIIAEAHIHAKAGKGKYAIDLLNKAIKKDKHNAAVAVDYFEKLLEVDPENGEAKNYIAVIEKKL